MEVVHKDIFTEKSANFAIKLFNEIVVEQGVKDGIPPNTIVSPISISVALAMAYAGAEASTKKEMNEQIFGQMDDNVIESNVRHLCKFLNKAEDHKSGFVLNLANRMFCQQGYNILETYSQFLKSHYATEASLVSFGTQQAVDQINHWVAEKTNQKIKKLFTQLDGYTRLVLVNAIYFKGDWRTKFEPSKTEPRPFHVTEQVTKQLDTMWAKSKAFHYNGEDEEWAVLELPYKGEQLSMVFFLPKEQHRFELNTLEKHMTGGKIWKLIDSLVTDSKIDIEVQLPKFKLESAINLNDCLSKMGVNHMFTPGVADFSKINGNAADLYVSQIAHKAFLEVNEEGSEAAASTGMAFATRSMPIHVRFFANHPFMHAIIDKSNRQLLFLGHFYG